MQSHTNKDDLAKSAGLKWGVRIREPQEPSAGQNEDNSPVTKADAFNANNSCTSCTLRMTCLNCYPFWGNMSLTTLGGKRGLGKSTAGRLHDGDSSKCMVYKHGEIVDRSAEKMCDTDSGCLCQVSFP